jgi:hypothetical protein
MQYGLELGTPLPYYDEKHRKIHFMNFVGMETETEEGTDREDVFA